MAVTFYLLHAKYKSIKVHKKTQINIISSQMKS